MWTFKYCIDAMKTSYVGIGIRYIIKYYSYLIAIFIVHR